MNNALYVNEIANEEIIEGFLRETVYEMLEIKDRYTVVPFSYPGWSTADYISKLAKKISNSMYHTAEQLGKEKFKKFNPEKTKLTPDILNEMWIAASDAITKEIYKGHAASDSNKIPGLDEAIEKGAIIARHRENSHHRVLNEAREEMAAQAEKIDYRDDLLRIVREKYFTYLQDNFGLFKEQSRELRSESTPQQRGDTPKPEWEQKMY